MLKGIPKALSPELLKTLAELGHGDEIVIADGNFPAHGINDRVIRADGIGGTEMLEAVLSLIPLDAYSDENFVLMNLTPSDVGKVNPVIWKEYENVARADENFKPAKIERFAFYERAKKAYAVIATGETAIYANVILKKGVVK